jgi:hypothetical protein
MWRVFFLASLVWLWLLPQAHPAGVQLGPLCVEGAVLVENEDDKTLEGDGYWYPITLEFEKQAGSAERATLVLYDRPLPPTTGFSTCRELINLAKSQGVNLLFSGTLKNIYIAGDFFRAVSPNDNRLQLKPGKFSAEVESISQGSLGFAGGAINLKGGRLRIRNSSQYLGGTKIYSGEFELEMTNRQIRNVPIVPTGDARLQTTFLPLNVNSPFKIRINMLTRQTQLWSGSLTGSPSGALAGNVTAFAGLSVATPHLTVNNIRLTATNGDASIQINGVKGKAERITWKQQAVGVSLNQPTFQLGTASGTATATATQLNVSLPVIRNASFTSPATTLGSDGQPTFLSGAFQASPAYSPSR